MKPFTDDEIRRHVISAIEETIDLFGETADSERNRATGLPRRFKPRTREHDR